MKARKLRILLGAVLGGLLAAGSAAAGTVEIENIAYTVVDPDETVPTMAEISVRATAIYVGPHDANDDIWLIGCFFNDSIGGDLMDKMNPDFFDPTEIGPIAGTDDRITCPGAAGLIPRCENGGNVQYFGWTEAAILHFGGPGNEEASADLPVQETNCGPAPGRIGGVVTGLGESDGVLLRNFIRDNGELVSAPTVNVHSFDGPDTDENFVFPDLVSIGHTYDVRVWEVTPGLSCEVTNGTGTMTGGDVMDVQVDCECDNGRGASCQELHPIGGQVSGVVAGEILGLMNTLDPPGSTPPSTETLVVNDGGPDFQFQTRGAVGATYDVAVIDINSDKTCTVAGGSGTVQGPVSVQVTCVCTNGGTNCDDPFDPDDFLEFVPEIPGTGMCDPFWRICDDNVPWWWGGPGPPTGPAPCQRVTICETCGTTTTVDDEGNIIVTEELCCTDQCASPSTVVLGAPSTVVFTPGESQTVSGIIDVAGEATDSNGVAGLLFYVDHDLRQLNNYTFNGTQFSGTLDTNTLSDGPHDLYLLSIDSNGDFPAATIYPRQIVVDNSGGGGQPEIDVFLNWNGSPIADGGIYVIGETTPPGVTISRRFRIENNGDATLVIGNPGSLISDPCFSQRDPVAGSIAPGGRERFWVDFNCEPDGTYETLAVIDNNDANEDPYTFTIRGTVETPPPGAPQITQQPESQTVATGSTVDFEVAASGAGTLTYQWFHNGLSIADGGKYSGATSPTLTVSNVDATVVGGYRCEVTGTGGTTSSSTASLGLIGGSCSANASTLCLQGNIFEARLTWRDPNTGLLHDGQSRPHVDESGFFYYVEPDNVEVGVKVLDGGSSWWIYHGGATTLEYTLTLTNTETGQVKTYFKPAGDTCGGADTSTFEMGGGSPALLSVPEWSLKDGGDCTPGPYHTCLLDDRFKVEVLRDGNPQRAVDFTPDSGLFWFFVSWNVEVLVKMVDATFPPFNHYWVFFASLTHVDYEVVVTDTVTGQVNTYASPGPYCGDVDTLAFPP